jgi:TPR repeat protein
MRDEAADRAYDDGVTAIREQNYDEAAVILGPLAESGHPHAQNALGYLYLNGYGVPLDDEKAAFWYRKSAEQGIAQSQERLGRFYESAVGVERNLGEAAKWYLLAAEQENSEAQFGYGLLLATGRGIEQDRSEAVRWYLRAAEHGHHRAWGALGMAYLTGLGVEQSFQHAAKWIGKSAEIGDSISQKTLGTMALNGHGIGKSDIVAYKWFSLAAKNGEVEAEAELERLKSVMSARDIVVAQELVKGWQASGSAGNPEPRRVQHVAQTLSDEFQEWYANLGQQGVILRAFSAVRRDGKQFIVIFSGEDIDHIERLDLMIWLCRSQDTAGYIYATQVMTEHGEEQVDFSASDDEENVATTLQVIRNSDETISYTQTFHKVMVPTSDDTVFMGLNRKTSEFDEDTEQRLGEIWEEISPRVRWQEFGL